MWFSPVRRLMFGLTATLTKKTPSAVKENTKAAAFFAPVGATRSLLPVCQKLHAVHPAWLDPFACESDRLLA